jgi:hypothetical protein
MHRHIAHAAVGAGTSRCQNEDAEVVPTDRHRVEHGRLSDRINPYDAFGNDTGTTVNTRPIPLTEPAKWAGGAGSIETGPASMRNVPSTSNVPSARIIGRGNRPWPQPTIRSQPASVTHRQAPSPLQRPMSRGTWSGPAGLERQAVQPHARARTSAAAADRLMSHSLNQQARRVGLSTRGFKTEGATICSVIHCEVPSSDQHVPPAVPGCRLP